MPNVHTKTIAILFILCSSLRSFGQLTLENIFLTNKYSAKRADDILFLHQQAGIARLTTTLGMPAISLYNSKNEKTQEWNLTPPPSQMKKEWSNLTISNSDNLFLVGSDFERLYRYSFSCNYYFGDKSGAMKALSDGKQLYPSFSPDDRRIAFVKNNNLFYKDIASNTEIQITKDGEWNKIINGKSDWAYEEELKLTRAYEWNSQSDRIAYLKFDESEVKGYQIPLYYDMQYPNYFNYKYPKVGEENSKVSVWVYDLKSKKNKAIIFPYSYEYIPRIYWNASGDEIVAMLLNRHQDSLQLVGYNIKTKKTRLLYVETDKAYVEVPVTVKFLTDNSFIITSEKDCFNHLYHYDKDGKLLKQLTTGNFEVKAFYGTDEKNKLIYFQSNEGNSIETAIFSLNYENLEKKRISVQNGSNKAIFSNDFSFYLHTFSDSKTPPQISLQQIHSDAKFPIESNAQLQDVLSGIPQKKFIQIPVDDNPLHSLNGWIIQPDTLSILRKYPVLLYVYGGPGDQEVLNEWTQTRDLFFNFLAEQGYIVACVDNRGTGGRGSEFKKCTFLNLGKLETEDQNRVAQYFASWEYYIDENRIGIYGWSYGGFLAANCLFEGNDVFKTAVAAAPVSNWNLYNNIYTERYMRTPQENPKGYNNYNPNVLSKNLKGNLLLIHGTADDNVHFQHSIQLINALNAANKTYQFYIYPDAEHGTTGKKMRYDLYHKIYLFLKEKL